MWRHTRWAAMGLAIIGFGIAPDGVSVAEAGEHYRIVSYEAFEYGFRGADRVEPGLANLQVVNTGKEQHQMQLVKLETGHSAADFAAAAKANPRRLPNWSRLVGGPNGIVAGERTSTLQFLAPGDYVLVCWMPAADGTPHFTLGMTKSITVTAGEVKPEPEIVPDITITLADFSYRPSKPITAGRHTIKVVNQGQQVHETLVVQLPAKGTAKAFGAALTPGKPISSSPPGKPMGGVVGLAPGDSAVFEMDFKPGRYGLLCLFPDHDTGQPHFEKGMAMEFDVK
ncbi:MAG: hypothetical protein AB1451_14490 [Nitrospirota bacterium]